MSALDLLLVALGAAVGAPLRYLAGYRLDGRVPWGTGLVNVVGSLLLGALVALSLGGSATALIGTGFCGGLTTYSSFAGQAHRLGPARGTTYAAATLLLSLTACAGGFVLAA